MELFDNWISSGGSDFESFKREVKEVDSLTGIVNIKCAANLTLLSLKRRLGENGYTFSVLNSDTIEAFNSGVINASDLPETDAELDSPLFDEMAKTSGLLVIDDNFKYIISKDAIFSLGERANVSGDRLRNRSLIRDLYIAEGLFPADEKIKMQMVYRKQLIRKGGKTYSMRKVFACMGNKFIYEPLQSLVDVVEKLLNEGHHKFGTPVVRSWSIDHKFCTIQIEFPEFDAKLPDNIIPGLCFITSDTGHSSFRVLSSFRFDGSEEVFWDEQTWTHASAFSSILSDVEDYIYNIFPAEFPSVIAGLKKKTKLKAKRDAYQFYSTELRLTWAVGKFRAKNLVETFKLDDVKKVSEYEIVKQFLTSQKYLESDTPKNARYRLAKGLGKAPFVERKEQKTKWEG